MAHDFTAFPCSHRARALDGGVPGLGTVEFSSRSRSAPAPATARGSRLSRPDRSMMQFDETCQSLHPTRSPLLSRLQGRAASGYGSEFSPDRRVDPTDRHIRRTRPGRRLQTRPGHRASTSLPDDHRHARRLQRGLGAVVCLRDDEQPARRLPDAGAANGGDGCHGRSSIWSSCDRMPRPGRPIRNRDRRRPGICRSVTHPAGSWSSCVHGSRPSGGPSAWSSRPVPAGPPG